MKFFDDVVSIYADDLRSIGLSYDDLRKAADTRLGLNSGALRLELEGADIEYMLITMDEIAFCFAVERLLCPQLI